MPDTEKRGVSRYLVLLAHEVLLPFLLVILGIVIFDPVKDWWLGPKNYKIYLVGASSPEIDKIFRGVRLGNGAEPLQIDDVPIVLETIDDQGDASKTAKLVSSKNDALLVIGHVYSQRTIDALPVYMGSDPPIPVIATKETSPNLLSPSVLKQCGKNLGCPILQMSPDNDEQAADALDFALAQAKKRRPLKSQDDYYDFVIVKESTGSNVGYINDLVDKFEALLQSDYSKKHARSRGTINVGDAATFATDVSGIMGFRPDAVIYVGQSPLARQFFSFYHDKLPDGSDPLDSGHQTGKTSEMYKPPIIVLCDAAVSPDVTTKGFMGLPTVFAMYPISFADYKQTDSVLGRDAFAVVAALVKEAGYHRPMTQEVSWSYQVRRVLQMHRVRDARSALAQALGDVFRRGTLLTGPTGNEYLFEFPYHRKNARFHVWSITGNGAVEADSMDGVDLERAAASHRYRQEIAVRQEGLRH